MATSNDIEIAPIGTKALLAEVAEHIRRDEALLRDRQNDEDLSQTVKHRIAEEADRSARLAGKVEALLRGWEAE